MSNVLIFVLTQIQTKRFNDEEIEIPLDHSQHCNQILDIYGVIQDGNYTSVIMEFANGTLDK